MDLCDDESCIGCGLARLIMKLEEEGVPFEVAAAGALSVVAKVYDVSVTTMEIGDVETVH